MKKRAFTLAEVLITLGIIGVVAALVMPSLIANYKKQQYLTQLKKISSVLGQAAKMAMAEGDVDGMSNTKFGVDYNNYNSEAKAASEWFLGLLNVVKICEDSLTPCLSDKYQNLDGTDITFATTYVCGALADGTSVCVNPPTLYDQGNESYNNIPLAARVLVDLNGSKGPNVNGRDLFSFSICEHGEIREYCSNDIYLDQGAINNGFNGKCLMVDSAAYGGCYAKIIQDGWKMDY